MAYLTLDELKADMDPQIYAQVTGGDDTVAEWAIGRAEAWFAAYLIRSDALLPSGSEGIVKQIASKRAQYELYARNEVEDIARDKRDDANELVRALLGDDPAAPVHNQNPAASVKTSSDYTPIDWSTF